MSAIDFDLATHNGSITIHNPETGQHRTFRIKTAKSMDGKRIAELLTGSDNESDYTGFGFVQDDGSIKVWFRKRGTIYERFADLLNRADHWQDNKGLEYLCEGRCIKCNKKLTDPISIKLGIGPWCGGRS